MNCRLSPSRACSLAVKKRETIWITMTLIHRNGRCFKFDHTITPCLAQLVNGSVFLTKKITKFLLKQRCCWIRAPVAIQTRSIEQGIPYHHVCIWTGLDMGNHLTKCFSRIFVPTLTQIFRYSPGDISGILRIFCGPPAGTIQYNLDDDLRLRCKPCDPFKFFIERTPVVTIVTRPSFAVNEIVQIGPITSQPENQIVELKTALIHQCIDIFVRKKMIRTYP